MLHEGEVGAERKGVRGARAPMREGVTKGGERGVVVAEAANFGCPKRKLLNARGAPLLTVTPLEMMV
jgi:hypothetical protein